MKVELVKDINLNCYDSVSIISAVDSELHEMTDIKNMADEINFRWKSGDSLVLSYKSEKILRVFCHGLGPLEELTSLVFRKTIGEAMSMINKNKVNRGLIVCDDKVLSREGYLNILVETLNLMNYKFEIYKTNDKDKEFELETISIYNPIAINKKEEAKLIEKGEIIGKSVNFARDLINEPANVLIPEELAFRAEKAGKAFGFKVEIKDKKAIEKLGMEAFLSVGKASVYEPRLIVMRYFGDKSNQNEILGLVGKGLTYDSGGLSIKPTDGMVSMKGDMGGAASVIGAISAIAKLKLKINVIAVVAACENVISGSAYRPGDVIGSMAGKKIEVVNTDAEGRLTLADAVHYIIEKEKVNRVIDLATLTGAVVVALGTVRVGLMTNNEDFYQDFMKASETTDERFWRLPADDDYKELLKSSIADFTNSGGRQAGTVTAGLFVKEFVQDVPWIHLDIAGTSSAQETKGSTLKGPTGICIRTLVEYASVISKSK
ncbi:MAG: leucyl aminopeptidase [Candidatus Cloacimonetes bacterium]|nr:leucyl aminopeptidase [Candidatus Cloacimonadota bacterium]